MAKPFHRPTKLDMPEVFPSTLKVCPSAGLGHGRPPRLLSEGDTEVLSSLHPKQVGPSHHCTCLPLPLVVVII